VVHGKLLFFAAFLTGENDSWCDFTRHFLHLKSEEPSKNKVLVLTTVLVDAINLGGHPDG
jgi:hypothetical protein